MQKCAKTKIRALFWMAHCAVPIAPRILKLYQNLLKNMLYWNPEGFFDTSIVKKMTESLKPLKTPQNGKFWDFDNFFGGQKKFLGQKFFLKYIPHYNTNFSIKLNFWNCNFHIFCYFGALLTPRGRPGDPRVSKFRMWTYIHTISPYIIKHHSVIPGSIIS